MLTLLIGLLVTGIAVALANEVFILLLASALVLLVFGLVGIFHYAIGRQMSYVAVKNLGANTSSAVLGTSVMYSMIFAVLFLNESVTLLIGTGAAMILIGVVLLETRSATLIRKGQHRSGYLAALGTGVIFGLTPIAISFGLSIYHYPVASTFISYVFATGLYLAVMNVKKLFHGIAQTPRHVLILYVVSSIFAAGAQLLRYGALSLAPVVLVAPILTTNPLFTLLITRGIAREIESFSLRNILGIVIVVVGAILVSLQY